jgi:hypothetical protein
MKPKTVDLRQNYSDRDRKSLTQDLGIKHRNTVCHQLLNFFHHRFQVIIDRPKVG